MSGREGLVSSTRLQAFKLARWPSETFIQVRCYPLRRSPGHTFRHPSAQQKILAILGGKSALRTLSVFFSLFIPFSFLSSPPPFLSSFPFPLHGA